VALRDNCLEIIDILLAFGANPAVKDKRGNNSFHIAAATRSPDVMRAIVKSARRKMDMNVLNECGKK
jgi:ankyrin repeat protein